MPATPKITGLLHNCLLNCALPILLENIDILADLESTNNLSTINMNPIVESYALLKTLFADYYGVIDKENFNFQKFSSFLKQYSFYAKEIILAPILRQFIASKLEVPGDRANLSSLKRDGSYTNLHFSDGYQLFYKFFGIRINIYDFQGNEGTEDPQNIYRKVSYNPATPNDVVYPFLEEPTLSLYFKNKHYELQPHENLKKATKLYNQEIEALPQHLKIAHNAISFSTGERATSEALAKLKKSIHAELNSLPVELSASKGMGSIAHSNSPFFILAPSQERNDVFRQSEPNDLPFADQLNNLINRYFGAKPKASPTLRGIFGAYLLERAQEFEWRDFFSQCFSWFIGCCFGYQTEAEKRKNYLEELLDTLIIYQKDNEKIQPVIDKIAQGKATFTPRVQEGTTDYNKSLLAKLSHLELALNELELNRQEEIFNQQGMSYS